MVTESSNLIIHQMTHAYNISSVIIKNTHNISSVITKNKHAYNNLIKEYVWKKAYIHTYII